MDTKTLEVLRLLAAHEAGIAELYRVYAEKLPTMKEFWEEMRQEEETHEQQLSSMIGFLKEGGVSFKQGIFNREALATSFKYLEAQYHKATRLAIDEINALSIALSIEKTMIEHRFFSVFETDSDEAASVFARLENDTRRHLENIQAAWESHRPARSRTSDHKN